MTAIDDNDNILLSSNLPCGLELINKTKFFRSPITHIWLCKKDIYRKLNYYREIPYAEDYDFILRAIDFGYKCDNHPEKLMFIRHRAGNTASTVSLKQRKTHSYVIKLAKEREKIHSLNDSFSSIKLEKHIHYWNVTNLLHNYSSKQLNLAYKENNKFDTLGRSRQAGQSMTLTSGRGWAARSAQSWWPGLQDAAWSHLLVGVFPL